ncbi:50S ribosomal protein L30 [Candidatus Woesearchaeota archaeon CG10_big_fil_rev_8_21_14_0_10_34_8]|nr:MAG: 50S ribosomal protein L30 [Candidatus Woesearchaeota archaeon CG10_big_fil_rev_8_21_14_0_10_34_8]
MAEESKKKLLVVRVRGNIRVHTSVKDTLRMLRLYNNNTCVIIDNNAINIGMLNKARDYITWGEADEKTIEELFAKRGEAYKGRLTDSKKKIQYKGRYVTHKGNKYKKFFRLSPPKKGFGSIKTPFSQKGALGYRGDKINTLVKGMI